MDVLRQPHESRSKVHSPFTTRAGLGTVSHSPTACMLSFFFFFFLKKRHVKVDLIHTGQAKKMILVERRRVGKCWGGCELCMRDSVPPAVSSEYT